MTDFFCKLIEARPSEDCGCPEEEWIMGSLVVTIHLEENGEGHIEVDGGDWQHDWFTAHRGMSDLRQHAADYITSLPHEADQ